MRTLAGKWIWIWNWGRCAPAGDGGGAGAVAARITAAGCAGVIVKAFDGPRWFNQGRAWREVALSLKERGVSVGGWGYAYGEDPAGEAQRAIETAQYGEADLLVLDVEVELKGRAEAAEELCRRIREALGPDYPLYFSSFAIAQYHQTFPFETFRRYCNGAVPQVYWNAFRWPVHEALSETYAAYAALGFPPERLFPAGGLYAEGNVRHPFPEEVHEFISGVASRGSHGVSFWSYEHMSEEMWEAVGAVPLAAEEDEMSSVEFEQVTRSVADLAARVDRVEAEVQALVGPTPAPAPQPQPRTYTVQPGDTLSGIAARLGLGDWHRLYEANTGVIGGNPNLIYPGQVLVLP